MDIRCLITAHSSKFPDSSHFSYHCQDGRGRVKGADDVGGSCQYLAKSDVRPIEEVMKPFLILLRHGADANIRDSEGQLLLHYVAKSDCGAAPRLIELLLPITVYEAEKEKKVPASLMHSAITHHNLGSVEALLKFTNKSDFVRSNRGYSKGHGDILMSDLTLLLRHYPRYGEMMNCYHQYKESYPNPDDHPHAVQLYRVVNIMIKQGWSVKAEKNAKSPLQENVFKLLRTRTDCFRHVIESLMKILISKGATLKPTEAEFIVNTILKEIDFNSQLMLLINYGVIPPETLLQVVPDGRADPRDPQDEEKLDTYITSRVALMLVINDNFGCQGRYAKKIEQAIELYSANYEAKEYCGQGVSLVRKKLRMGTLKMQTRAVIRQQLQTNEFFHPWQMSSALQDCLHIKSLVEFVANTKVSVAEWITDE